MIFFTDENISHKHAKLLDLFDQENEIRAHRDDFESRTPDETWLSDVSKWKPKPAILCGDGRILRSPAQKQVLKQCNLTFILLAKGCTNIPYDEFARKIIKIWPKVVQNVSRARKPTLFKIGVRGKKVEQRNFIADL